MAANADFSTSALLGSDSELREVVNAILGAQARDDSYLDAVFSICRRKPQAAGILREIMDRYQRMGRIPRTQHRKIQTRIEQAQSRRAAPTSPAAPSAATRADAEHLEDLTCDLTAEHIAAATRGVSHANSTPSEAVRPDEFVDPNPTLETPPPTPRPKPRGMPAEMAERADLVNERTELLAARDGRLAKIAAIVAEHADLLAGRNESLRLTPASRNPAPAPNAADPPAATAADFPAQFSARYELQLLLGRGGMASVYKAVDRERVRLGFAERFVALKVVRTDKAHPARAAALLQEFQSAQRLSHPNIIHVFDIDQAKDATFYSMELLSGARLSQVARRVDGTALQRPYALAIIRDIGAAISHAHSRGVVHADLKPSNVMITQQSEVRVLDFGGSSMPPREPWVSDGEADDAFHQATPAFASCEQLERRRADPRDDIYALACIAYVLLSGRHPFDHLSSLEARSRGLEPQRPPGVPRSQWRVLRHGLMFERDRQPESIDPWLAGLGLKGAAARLPPLQDLTAPGEPPAPTQRAILIAAAALVVTVGTWAVLSKAAPDWQQTLGGAVTAAWDSVHDAFAPASPAIGEAAADTSSMTPSAAPPTAAPIAAPPSLVAPGPAAPARTPASALAAGTSATKMPPARTPVAATTAVIPPDEAAMPTATPTSASVADATPHVTFTAQNYVAGPGDPAARIIIQREAGSEGDLNFIWWTEGGSAEPDVDYAPLGARTERLASGQDKLTVYVPIISNPQRIRAAQFRVALVDATSHRGDKGAPSAHATVTIEGGR